MIKVVDWISYDVAVELPEAVGGLGGWFGMHGVQHRWADYLNRWHVEAHPYLEAIRASVLERNLRVSGDAHQNSERGCPLFSDGMSASFSFRGWGDLMAAIWSEKEDKNYSYMDFYYR